MGILKTYKKGLARMLLCMVLLGVVSPAVVTPVEADGVNPTAGGNFSTNTVLQNQAQTLESVRTQKKESEVKDIDFGCSFKSDFGAKLLTDCLAMLTFYVLFKPIAAIVMWISFFFNIVFWKLVIGMGDLINSITGVTFAWQAMRDLANILLVFLAVYVGIATILGISGYGAKQMLWKVIIAALFVNFSITLTKGIIDISNYLSFQLYEQFVNTPLAVSDGSIQVMRCDSGVTNSLSTENAANVRCVSDGIADAFAQRIQIYSTFDLNPNSLLVGEESQPAQRSFNRLVGLLMGSVFMAIFGLVILAVAALLVTRFVALLFLLIVSPFALTMLLLGISSLGKEWWSRLIKESFFAPAILLMWWIAWVILSSSVFHVSSNLAATSSLQPNAFDTFMTYVIAIGFLIFGLIVARKLGATGAAASIKMGRNMAVAVGAGVAAYGVGSLSARAQRLDTKRYAEAFEKNEDGTYKNNNILARSRRVIGTSVVGRSVNKALGAGAETKFGGKKSFNERRADTKKAKEQRQAEFDREAKNRQFAKTVGDPNTTPQQMQAVVEKATHAQLLENASTLTKNPKATGYLSQSTFNQLVENKEGTFSEEQVASFKEARKNHFKNLPATDVPDVLRKTKAKDLVEQDVSFLGREDVAQHIDANMMNGLVANGITEQKREAIESARKNHFKNLPATDVPDVLRRAKPKDLVEHDVSFLGRKEVVERLDTDTLKGLIANGLTQEKREVIRTQVETLYKNVPKQSSTVVGPDGSPITPPTLTPEEKNITELYSWFNNPNRPTV